MADVKANIGKVLKTVGTMGLSLVTHGMSDRVIDAVVENKNLSLQARDELAKARQESKDKLLAIEEEMTGKIIDASSQMVIAVNQTMQAEAKSEHWMQWSWRPLCGYTLAALVINNYILCPYFRGFGVVPIEVPELVWQTLLSVVGVSALTRGLSQAANSWKSGKVSIDE